MRAVPQYIASRAATAGPQGTRPVKHTQQRHHVSMSDMSCQCGLGGCNNQCQAQDPISIRCAVRHMEEHGQRVSLGKSRRHLVQHLVCDHHTQHTQHTRGFSGVHVSVRVCVAATAHRGCRTLSSQSSCTEAATRRLQRCGYTTAGIPLAGAHLSGK